MSNFWHQLLHAAAHVAGHAMSHHRHQQHARAEAERQRAHSLSPFAASVYDACLEAGYAIQTLEAQFAAYVVDERVICFAQEETHFACFAVTPFKFYSRVPEDLGRFLDNRNSTLQYGEWMLHPSESHQVLMFRVAVEPGGMSDELFRTATQYAWTERSEVEAILLQAGYKPS